MENLELTYEKKDFTFIYFDGLAKIIDGMDLNKKREITCDLGEKDFKKIMNDSMTTKNVSFYILENDVALIMAHPQSEAMRYITYRAEELGKTIVKIRNVVDVCSLKEVTNLDNDFYAMIEVDIQNVKVKKY